MSGIIRAPRPARGWTEIQNTTLRDARLSYRARGVLARLLSNADGWRMTAHELSAESPGEGRQAVLTALRELREAGYIVQRRLQGERGQWRTETVVYDTPQESTEVRLPDSGSTEVRSPDSGGPDAGGPDRIRRTTKKKQENEHKKNHHQTQRERGEAPPEGGKPPLSLAGGGNSGGRENSNGICLQGGNQRDAETMTKIAQYTGAEVAAAVVEARKLDPQGRAWPTAVLKLLLQARKRGSRVGQAQDAGPAWARRYRQPAAGGEIDITDYLETDA